MFAAVFMVVMLSSIGLPGLNGFVGEFLILLGTFLKSQRAAEVAVFGVVLGALYMVWAYERVMWGPITKTVNQTIKDLSKREIAVMVPLIALMLLMGLYPRPLLSRMEPSLNLLLNRVGAAQARLDAAHTRAHTRTIAAPAAPVRNLADK
jgi:NADH-quinone oxidoreductase subunit M